MKDEEAAGEESPGRWETEEECTTLCPPDCPAQRRRSAADKKVGGNDKGRATGKLHINRITSTGSRDTLPRLPFRSESNHPSRWSSDY